MLKETDVAYRAEIGKWYISEKRITDSSEYCHVTNLPPASWHDFRLRAHNSVGYSQWCEESSKVRLLFVAPIFFVLTADNSFK